MNLFKSLFISNSEKEVKAYRKWAVKWTSAHRTYHDSSLHDVEPVAEFFFSEKDANDFAKALATAFELVRYHGYHNIRVKKE